MKRAEKITTLFVIGILLMNTLPAKDVMDTYEWKQIWLGGGGYTDGIICSEKDSNVRFLRHDTGQAYRWSAADNRWIPMVVQNDDGSGFASSIIPVPGHAAPVGVDGMALDPNDDKTIYLYLTFGYFGGGASYNSRPYEVYKSVDGGRSFTATHFTDASKFTAKTNDAVGAVFRQDGERMAVDPNNSKVVYIGTGTRGVYRSVDGGDTWTAVKGGGLPEPKGRNDFNVLFYRKGGVTAGANPVSKNIYLVYIKDKADAPTSTGGVYCSEDGGKTWNSITANVAGPGEFVCGGMLDPNTGALYVKTRGEGASKGWRHIWKYDAGAWTKIRNADTAVMTMDPRNPNNLVAMGAGGKGMSISTDAGKTWKDFDRCMNPAAQKPLGFCGIGVNYCYGGLQLDISGNLWLVIGNQALVTRKFSPDMTDMNIWNAACAGIENFCADDIAFPKNGNGRIVVSVQDNNGFVVNNPDTFDLTWFKMSDGLCNGLTISLCPNNPDTLAIVGYQPGLTCDGGKNITKLKKPSADKKSGFGNLQISRRGNWGAGADHLVWVFNGTAFYSKDGGATWAQTQTDLNQISIPTSPWTCNYNVISDPFVADKFYIYSGDGQFWTTTNCGETWTKGNGPGDEKKSGFMLRVNCDVPNDLWAGNNSGVFHSTDAGITWNEVKGNNGFHIYSRLSRFAVGKGSGKPGDTAYTLYYVHADADVRSGPAKDYGIYRSTNDGKSWDRIATHPCGYLCACQINASWDTYGLVGVGINGLGFVYGKLK